MEAIEDGVRERLRDDSPILLGLLSTWIVVLLFLARKGVRGLRWNPWEQNFTIYAVSLGVILVLVGTRLLYRDRPVSPFRYLRDEVTSTKFIMGALGGLPMLMAMIGFIPIFSSVKTSIPLVTTYSWDAALIAADHMIFGTDAWRVLQPVLGFPIVTSFLSYCYHAWVVLLYGCGIYFCFFVQDRHLRAQYFIARFAVWIVMGMVMATAFASVGPCFANPILGNHHFDAQMAYLREANLHYPVLVLPVQDQLLFWFRETNHDLGAGISAMPSLHVGMSVLSTFALWRISRPAGIGLVVFTILIALGSVHLGYHYALDGIVSAATTAVLWWVSGICARKLTDNNAAAKAASAPQGIPGLAAG